MAEKPNLLMISPILPSLSCSPAVSTTKQPVHWYNGRLKRTMVAITSPYGEFALDYRWSAISLQIQIEPRISTLIFVNGAELLIYPDHFVRLRYKTYDHLTSSNDKSSSFVIDLTDAKTKRIKNRIYENFMSRPAKSQLFGPSYCSKLVQESL